ncbi:MAG TPA: hypothetical protein VM818_21475 [Vicinamibacterales bacterium]|nr:hypothetical protein [Vicinamibacterales bacterium]
MGSILKKSALLAAALLIVQAGTARAASVEVKVPFPFTVNGHQMPAGQYVVENRGADLLIRGERGTGATMFVAAMPAAGYDPAGDRPSLTFAHNDAQYQLSTVWESGTEGRVIRNR